MTWPMLVHVRLQASWHQAIAEMPHSLHNFIDSVYVSEGTAAAAED